MGGIVSKNILKNWDILVKFTGSLAYSAHEFSHEFLGNSSHSEAQFQQSWCIS